MHYSSLALTILLVSSFCNLSQGQMISNRKSAFIDHINNFLNKIASPQEASNVSIPAAPRSAPAGANIPVSTTTTLSPMVVRAGENPAAAVQRLQNSVVAVNLMETIAPPAVRPCFVRPAFCPATSDACSKSRCARLYANGVRIGSRFYKRVKCRLNYCRETCGKAEWYADGRRLVGCSDSSSTLDAPIWSVQRVFPRPSRLDSRVLPIERVANTRVPPGAGGIDFKDVQAGGVTVPSALNKAGQSNPQRRSVQAWIGDLGETMANKSREFGDAIKQKFDELNSKRKENAIARATNLTLARDFDANMTSAFIDKQLEEATNGLEHVVEHEEHSAVQHGATSGQPQAAKSSKTDLWFVLFLVGMFYSWH